MSVTIPDQQDALLTRDQAAAALTAAGFPIKPKTLAARAARKEAPPYQLFGSRALYKWGELEAWARSRLRVPPSLNISTAA